MSLRCLLRWPWSSSIRLVKREICTSEDPVSFSWTPDSFIVLAFFCFVSIEFYETISSSLARNRSRASFSHSLDDGSIVAYMTLFCNTFCRNEKPRGVPRGGDSSGRRTYGL